MYNDDGYTEDVNDWLEKRYRLELAMHWHPSDPDHPQESDYFDDDETMRNDE